MKTRKLNEKLVSLRLACELQLLQLRDGIVLNVGEHSESE